MVGKEIKKYDIFKQLSSDSKHDQAPVNQDKRQVLNIKDV